MFERVLYLLLRPLSSCALVVLILTTGVSAAGAAWPVEPGADTLLGYGVPYSRDGRTTTHSGLDLTGDEGSRVCAPAAGEITFCGMVPSGTGTVLALTVTTGDGLKITLMPLLSADVVEGQTVDVSQALAVLAGSGDPSSPEPHLHIGVRRGDSYIDPAIVLGPVAASPEVAEPEVPTTPPVMTETAVQEPAEPSMAGPEPVGSMAAEAVASALPAQATQAPGLGTVGPSLDSEAVRPVGASVGGIAVQTPVRAAEVAGSERAPVFRTLHAPTRSVGRTRSMGGSAPTLALLAAGALALWPLWRKRGHPVPDVRPRFDDVAAAVSR